MVHHSDFESLAVTGAAEFGEGFVGCGHPFDAGSEFISPSLPCGDLNSEPFGVLDAAAETLALKHADLALDHVEPTGVLRGEVEFEAAQDTSGLGGREGLIQRPRLVDRQIVLRGGCRWRADSGRRRARACSAHSLRRRGAR